MANSATISGKFLGTGPIKTVGQNNRQIRSFWVDLTDNPDYPNTPEFQLWGDKVYLTESIQKGQTIEVKFNLSGRKFKNQQGKEGIITNLDAWQINVVQVQSAAARPVQTPPAGTPARSAAPQPLPQQQASPYPFATQPDDNDLPF